MTQPVAEWREGPPVEYVPVIRRPLLFPFQAGIVGYCKANGDKRPVCAISGQRIEDRRPGE